MNELQGEQRIYVIKCLVGAVLVYGSLLSGILIWLALELNDKK